MLIDEKRAPAFVRTTAIDKLLSLTKRKRIIQGGTWAGKTFGIIPVLINKIMQERNKTITVVAESIPAIKDGALKNFIEIMQLTNRWVDAQYNATDRSYYIPTTGSKIKFSSFDTIGKAKASGKRTDLFINEANYIPFEIAYELMIRTDEVIWIDFNPVAEFWAHTEVKPQSDAEFIILKYTDNEALPDTIKRDLLANIEKAKTSEYWANWCKVYIDGEIGSLQGVIFPNVTTNTDKFPTECKWICYGLDFGYTNDPTTLIKVGLFAGELYYEEMMYQTGMTNSEISARLKTLGLQGEEIIADSAEPKSVIDLRRMGWNVRGAAKGPDSVRNGIDLMNQYKINIISSSRNMIKEQRNYLWTKDAATGKFTNKPVDEYNHCWDAARYATMFKMRRSIAMIN